MVRTIHFSMMLISLSLNLSYHSMKAAKNDMFSCLTYAHENGCPWNEATCRMAAENNMLQKRMYLGSVELRL